MTCARCGSGIDESDRFCKKCGVQLETRPVGFPDTEQRRPAARPGTGTAARVAAASLLLFAIYLCYRRLYLPAARLEAARKAMAMAVEACHTTLFDRYYMLAEEAIQNVGDPQQSMFLDQVFFNDLLIFGNGPAGCRVVF